MRKYYLIIFWMLVVPPTIVAASKPHMITFGKPTTVRLFSGADESKPPEVKVRALYVDGKLKEFITGDLHDITDQQFTVQRAYRVNDSLPQDERSLPKWRWQRGGWISVNRTTGHIASLRLPQFDAYYSHVAWFREYAAYCGTSDNGDKIFAIVAQLGIRKPLARKLLGPTNVTDTGQECGRPVWQRQPPSVTFDALGQKVMFAIRRHAADLAAAPSPQPNEPAEEESN